MFFNFNEKRNDSGIVMPEKPSVPTLGLGSAFAAIPPPPTNPFDQRPHERYPWETSLFHQLHYPAAVAPAQIAPPAPSLHPALPTLHSPTFELPHLLGSGLLGQSPLGAASDLVAPPPAYRIPPYMEHLYQTLHASPQGSLRGISPLERTGLTLGTDYLGMSGLAASRLNETHLLPSSLTSNDLAFSIDAAGSMLLSPRASLRQSRKRALSASPYSDTFDISSMMRYSPTSLVSLVNMSRSPSSSGSYGHLSAGAISPALGPSPINSASTQLQQLQAHLMRGSIPGSHFLSSPLLQHHPATSIPHQAIFPYGSHIPPPQPILKPEGVMKNGPYTEDHKLSKALKENHHPHAISTPGKTKIPLISGATVLPIDTAIPPSGAQTGTHDEENLKEEPEDFIETNCNWKECDKEFSTQDELVKHINGDHIHANKKNFVCRWESCSREEKPFKAQYMLVVHMRRHTGEKPHRCTFEGCLKAYSRLENLKTHLRSHTGEKPYVCEYPGCTKAFSNASDRAKHQNRTHSNEKPYVCKAPDCTKRYTDPSSLRKHVKTVHGAEFYASKKHKGNDHPNSGHNGPHKGPNNGANSESSPHSESGKGGSMSSPSVRSEDPTSPGNGPTPPSAMPPPVSMDQTRLLNGPISDNIVSTTNGLDPLLRGEWQQEDDPERHVNFNGFPGRPAENGSLTTCVSNVIVPERGLRGKLKTRSQVKGLANVSNVPVGQRKSSGGVTELSQRITDLKMSNQAQHRNKNALEPGFRRDSSGTISTYYGSMQSEQSLMLMGRRDSELSQTSNISAGHPGRRSVNTSLYDPISCGSSRRSSENSSYNPPYTMNGCMSKYNRNGIFVNGSDPYNASNLAVQTQNMSLSQGSLVNTWNTENNGVSSGATMGPGSIESSNSTYFGCARPIGPPNMPNREASRRASDPIKPLDRGFADKKLSRHNSYSNFNSKKPNGYNHPNQGLQLDQVGDDEPIENKLILPDDMVNYLNQNGTEIKTEVKDSYPNFNNPVPSPGFPISMPNPAYPNQSSSMSPFPGNQNLPVHGSYQYNQAGYPSPMGYNQQGQFNSNSAMPFNTMNPGCFPNQGYVPQAQQNINGSYQQFNYNQYPQHMLGQHQMFGPFVQNHLRYNSYCQPPYNFNSESYGPVHICGHLAPPNLPPIAYQTACSACLGNSNGQGQSQPNNWPINSFYGSMHGPGLQPGFPEPSATGEHNLNTSYQVSIASDVQCRDVSQSSQSSLTPNPKNSKKDGKNASLCNEKKDGKTTSPNGKIKPNKTAASPEKVKSSKTENTESNKLKSNIENTESFMKSDTYKRTLEYVKKCQNWSNSVVKEEVSSTTDQKPELDLTGTVVGYSVPSTSNGYEINLQNTVISENTRINPAPPSIESRVNTLPPSIESRVNTLPPSIESRFNTPLPPPIQETTNMVINDLTSSLNSLQEENRFLQMLQ